MTHKELESALAEALADGYRLAAAFADLMATRMEAESSTAMPAPEALRRLAAILRSATADDIRQAAERPQ